MTIEKPLMLARIWSSTTRPYGPWPSNKACQEPGLVPRCWSPKGCQRGCVAGGPVRRRRRRPGRRPGRPCLSSLSVCSPRWRWPAHKESPR